MFINEFQLFELDPDSDTDTDADQDSPTSIPLLMGSDSIGAPYFVYDVSKIEVARVGPIN